MDNLDLDKQDIKDMHELLYFAYRTLKSNNNIQISQNIDIDRLFQLKKKLDKKLDRS